VVVVLVVVDIVKREGIEEGIMINWRRSRMIVGIEDIDMIVGIVMRVIIVEMNMIMEGKIIGKNIKRIKSIKRINRMDCKQMEINLYL
jgi:hypothetical protein